MTAIVLRVTDYSIALRHGRFELGAKQLDQPLDLIVRRRLRRREQVGQQLGQAVAKKVATDRSLPRSASVSSVPSKAQRSSVGVMCRISGFVCSRIRARSVDAAEIRQVDHLGLVGGEHGASSIRSSRTLASRSRFCPCLQRLTLSKGYISRLCLTPRRSTTWLIATKHSTLAGVI
jgi:hypothetical protein